jgi:hypothetical protein
MDFEAKDGEAARAAHPPITRRLGPGDYGEQGARHMPSDGAAR